MENPLRIFNEVKHGGRCPYCNRGYTDYQVRGIIGQPCVNCGKIIKKLIVRGE